MAFDVSIEEVRKLFPDLIVLEKLTPSEQKAAFHVKNKSGEELCLKIISPQYDIGRLNREITALQTISHPNVAKLKEYVFLSKNGLQQHYMLEEYIEGKDLSESLNCSWKITEIVSFFSDMCDGLEELRKANIVHRDLKPSNIRVRINNKPVIIDFGLARHLNLPDITYTVQGARIGTPKYFAPEQFTGTKYEIDHRTDLFALGILMYEAAIGKHPFYNEKMTMKELEIAVCRSIDFKSCKEYVQINRKLQLLINRLLEKERISRPASAGQVKKILNAIEGK